MPDDGAKDLVVRKELSLNLNFSFLNWILLLLTSSSYPIFLTRLGGPRSRPYRGSVPNAEYASKLEYLDILVKTIDISELVGIRCGDRQMLSTCNGMNVCEECSLFYRYIYISWNSEFLQVNFETLITRLLFIINISF